MARCVRVLVWRRVWGFGASERLTLRVACILLRCSERGFSWLFSRASLVRLFPPFAADLRDGPCGETFKGAFRCYVKSSHEEKGMDCIEQFQLFQGCLSKHPEHVEAILDDAEEKEKAAEEAKGAAQGEQSSKADAKQEATA